MKKNTPRKIALKDKPAELASCFGWSVHPCDSPIGVILTYPTKSQATWYFRNGQNVTKPVLVAVIPLDAPGDLHEEAINAFMETVKLKDVTDIHAGMLAALQAIGVIPKAKQRKGGEGT